MTPVMRKKLVRLPYREKLQKVAELIEFSCRFKAAALEYQTSKYPSPSTSHQRSGGLRDREHHFVSNFM